MNITEIQRQIELSKTRIRQVETALQAPQSLDDGLRLQRELSDLQAYLQRLTAQHAKALADEGHLQKERVIAQLNTELAELAAQAHDLKSQVAEMLRDPNRGLADMYDAVVPLHDELVRLDVGHERLYSRRYGTVREQGLIGSRAALVPAGVAQGDLERVIKLALETLHAERTGYGHKVDDLYNALALRSRSFGV